MVGCSFRTRGVAGVLFLLIATRSAALNFRGEIAHTVTVDHTAAEPITLHAYQVLLIDVREETQRYAEAVELRVTPPATRGPTFLSLRTYGAVSYEERLGVASLVGVSLGNTPLEGSMRTVFRVPFSDQSSRPSEAGVVLLSETDVGTGYIAVQLVPTTKGMSDPNSLSSCKIAVTPVLRNVGGIRILLEGSPDARRLIAPLTTLSLAGQEIDEGRVYERTPGIYLLEAEAGAYLSYTANVGVERGVTREVGITVSQPLSTVRLTVPSVAEVLWNGELITTTSFSAPPGVHDVMIRLGDYTVTRSVTVKPLEDVEVSINLDILLTEY